MISKSLSTSQKYADLGCRAGDLGEFCQSLYPLIVAHTDDFGRLQGDPFTVKHQCHPTSPRSLGEFTEALRALDQVGLITWFQTNGHHYIQIENFDVHQSGLHRRSQSTYPSPDGVTGKARRKTVSALDASEEQIEAWLVRLLKKGRLVFSGLTVTSVDRQVRRESSYFDILATTAEGPLILIEVKRQRVTEAAVAQVLKYRDLLGKDVVPVVIGSGLAIGKLADQRALIATYDDKYRLTPVTSISVKSREITLTYLPSEEKGTEENLTKGNGTDTLSDRFAVFSKEYPASRRVGGEKARRAFANAFKGVEDADTHFTEMLTALRQHKRSRQWTEADPKIPLMTTWLSQERWHQVLPEVSAPPHSLTPFQQARRAGLK